MITHIFFDFFGTLVDYSPSMTEQGYHRSHSYLTALGITVDYDVFLSLWSDVSHELLTETGVDHREYSMAEVTHRFLERLSGSSSSDEIVHGFFETYLEEWNRGVAGIDGVASFLEALGTEYRIGLITNTHWRPLVIGHLD